MEHTQYDHNFLVGFRERVWNATFGQDDDGSVQGCPEPKYVCVPKEGAPLAGDGEVVHIALTRLDRALGNVRRPVGPPRPQLPDTVPDHITHQNQDSIFSRLVRIKFNAELSSPVDGDIVFDKVGDPDEHGVVFPSVESGSREPPVHGHDGLARTQPRRILHYHLPN